MPVAAKSDWSHKDYILDITILGDILESIIDICNTNLPLCFEVKKVIFIIKF